MFQVPINYEGKKELRDRNLLKKVILALSSSHLYPPGTFTHFVIPEHQFPLGFLHSSISDSGNPMSEFVHVLGAIQKYNDLAW